MTMKIAICWRMPLPECLGDEHIASGSNIPQCPGMIIYMLEVLCSYHFLQVVHMFGSYCWNLHCCWPPLHLRISFDPYTLTAVCCKNLERRPTWSLITMWNSASIDNFMILLWLHIITMYMYMYMYMYIYIYVYTISFIAITFTNVRIMIIVGISVIVVTIIIVVDSIASVYHYCHYSCYSIVWLVVGPPLWKIWVRQLGWWHSLSIWENRIDVPNHQPVVVAIPKQHIRRRWTAVQLSSLVDCKDSRMGNC